ncbi:hypothetical protein GOP47_0011232 [Adiantum capillus-veneris]|uniref:Protein kinase domain-containing protein n=1 Tax=Adiantum capillus-veneris TaxID=13818 RepID=A0A9D4USD7_ADICA|nr:hypothetical protein GOP47_0011232 [Adiantum capillus-veneris]
MAKVWRSSQQLVLLQLCVVAVQAARLYIGSCEGIRSRECPACGKMAVPYPLSTSDSCGHPLYKLVTCTDKKTLQVKALSGNYSVLSLDPLSRSIVISTSPFIGDSCITQDSVTSHNFSLFPGSPLTVGGGNTVLLLNGTDVLRYSPLNCRPDGPCGRGLQAVQQKSCRSLLCCSLVIHEGETSDFRYGFPVFGMETGYVSLLDFPDPSVPTKAGVDAGTIGFGMRLKWEAPGEPTCETQMECGADSTCVKAAAPICACNHGYRWDATTGTCPKVPFCIRDSGSIKCHKIEYATGLTLGFVGLIAFISFTVWMYRRRGAAQRAHAKLVEERNMILATNSGGKSARLFSKQEMKRATNNFAPDRVLGCGGFGEVYKGILDDETEVAIKCTRVGKIKGVDPVLNEVRILSQVNHRNLVRLLGCCVESELPLMVYEYVPNGNLEDHILQVAKSNVMLDWKTRLQIAFQSAEGLAYLHSAAYPPIYHRDVKASNILLDKSMNAKVADFGLSRLAEPDLTHISTCAQGTMGYLDPEYYRNYQLTDKSDVYSFGVVLLTLVTSERAIDFKRNTDDVNLATMVQIRKEHCKIDEVLDPQLVKGASKETVNSMRWVIDLALECLHESRLNRPSMKEVSEMLQQLILSLEASEREGVQKSDGYVYIDV